MSNAIRFLEAIAIQHPGEAHYGTMVANLDLDNPQKRALMNCDGAALARLLGGRDVMCCMVLGTDPTEH
jgi:hypothetical protein